MKEASRIKALTEREIGKRLTEMQEAGELASQGGDRKSKSQAGILILDDLGITLNQSSRFQREASLSDERFDELGDEESALRQMAWVAKSIPFVNRLTNVSWTHHLAVAALAPREQRKFLTMASPKEGERVLRFAKVPRFHKVPSPNSLPRKELERCGTLDGNFLLSAYACAHGKLTGTSLPRFQVFQNRRGKGNVSTSGRTNYVWQKHDARGTPFPTSLGKNLNVLRAFRYYPATRANGEPQAACFGETNSVHPNEQSFGSFPEGQDAGVSRAGQEFSHTDDVIHPHYHHQP